MSIFCRAVLLLCLCTIPWPCSFIEAQSLSGIGINISASKLYFKKDPWNVAGTKSDLNTEFSNTAVFGIGLNYETTSPAGISWGLGISRLSTEFTVEVEQIGRFTAKTAPSYLLSVYVGYSLTIGERVSLGLHTGCIVLYRPFQGSMEHRVPLNNVFYSLENRTLGNLIAVPLRIGVKYSFSDQWALVGEMQIFGALGAFGYDNQYTIYATDYSTSTPTWSATQYYYNLNNYFWSLGLQYGLAKSENKDTWIEFKAGRYFPFIQDQGAEDWIHVKHEIPILIGATLHYKLDQGWRIFLEISKAYGMIRHWNLLRTDDMAIDDYGGLFSIAAGAGYSVPTSKHFSHRFQLSAGIHATGINRLDAFTRGETDTTNPYIIHSKIMGFKRAFGYTAEYSLDYTPGKHFTISAFAGMRQLLSSEPYYLIETTFTEKATGGIHAEHQYKIRKLMFHAGLGISFPL